MATPKVLRDWCRVACAGYPGVEIKDLSASFRDGLAFCAVIHKHRPDLIDFSSLSKDNVYQNNKLAFEVAESKLGIPALLDPKEMVSAKVPDCLCVISYLSQYYCFFTRRPHGPAGLRSSHVSVSNNLAKIKTPDGLTPLKSSTHLETGKDRLSSTRPRTACSLCFKPVHLIQRHLIDGKIYHRSCFRCKLCHRTLLPESYTNGSDAGSLICTHHITDSKTTRVDISQQIGSAENRPKCKLEAVCFPVGGLAVTGVPHYTKKTESQDRPVCGAAETERTESQERSREAQGRGSGDSAAGVKSMVKKPGPPQPPPPGAEDRTVEGPGKAGPGPDRKIQQDAACVRVTEGNGRPVPAPRRMFDSSGAPIPAPRTKTSLKTIRSPAAGCSPNQSKSPITSPTGGQTKVKTNHPWMAIVHPGPWTQLPPAPAPVPTPRSKAVSHPRGPWYRSRVPAPNPFAEDLNEGTQGAAVKTKSTARTKSSGEASHSENGGNLTDTSAEGEVTVGSGDAENTVIKSDDNDVKSLDKPKDPGGAAGLEPAESVSALTDAVETIGERAGITSQMGSLVLDENRGMGGSLEDVTEAAAGPRDASGEAQGHFFPRSLSVPAIASAPSQSCLVPVGLTEADESVTSHQSKTACKENPFDRKPSMPKSKTFQALPPRRAPAPGHGFPLIKRKVQTDQYVSTQDLQTEMGEVEKQLAVLERRGLELENDLRGGCKNEKVEEQMFMDWFSLMHERQVLVRRDTELVYLSKQQNLEERQADVEYELRCLLNKPESDWSQEDRAQEQQMMDELVAIIEQRNQIISSLDRDRQREREEDSLWESSMKNKDVQKDGLKDLKKSKGKFKPTKVFKILNHKAEGTKDSSDKKS